MNSQITLKYKNEVGFTFTTPAPNPTIWEELYEDFDGLELDMDSEWEHYFVKGLESNKGDDSISFVLENSLTKETLKIPICDNKAIIYLNNFMSSILLCNAEVLDVKLFIKRS